MSGAAPWSVKGIDPRAREAAREAARRRGLTIGEWLNQAILANEAALASVRRDAPQTEPSIGNSTLDQALMQLSERVDANDRRAALAIGNMDRSLAALGERIHAGAPDGSPDGRVDGLLAELREAQAAMLQRMRRLEDEEITGLKTDRSREVGKIGAVEENVAQLAARVTGAEAQTGEALRNLQASLATLDQKVAQARPQIDEQAIGDRFAVIAENLTHEVESARSALTAQLAEVLGELRPEEMRAALGDLSKRIAAAERRHAQTIEAVSIEIKRLNEAMERRLRAVEARNDDSVAARDQARELAETVEQRFAQMASREVAFADHISEEVGRIGERLESRVALSEQRGAEAISHIGEQISAVAERLQERQDRLASDVADRLQDSEERQAAHLNDALHNLSGFLEEIEMRAASHQGPVHGAMTAFADRLHAIEQRIAAPAPLPSTPTPAPITAPVYIDLPRPSLGAPAPSPPGLDEEALANHHDALREVAAHLAAKSEAAAQVLSEDTIFVEDIEARFVEHAEGVEVGEDHSTKYRLADDPFADLDAETSADDDKDLFWNTGQDEPQLEAGDEPDMFGANPAGTFNTALDDNIGLSEIDFNEPAQTEFERAMLDQGLDLDHPAPKDDYLSAARRAAQARAEVQPPVEKSPAGLRGVTSLVLWTATAAVAAALAGSAFYYREHMAAEPARTAKPPPPADAPEEQALAPAPGSIAESEALLQSAPQAEPPTEAQPAPAEPAPARAGPLHPTGAPAAPTRLPTLEQAALRGDPAAAYELALLRFEEANPAAAIALLRRAADQGSAMAQYRLAKAYERGEGVATDRDQARRWTERAAFAGNARAMHDLGVYLASAQGPALDEASAFNWFKQAAELGVADSQFNIALMYQQGRGAAPNVQQAYYWFQVAAARGDQDAAARGAMIERQIGAAARAVRERARAFTAQPLIAEANGAFDRSWAPSGVLQASAASDKRT